MATYYVVTTGNDGNPGTEASPWLTIQKALATLVAGDTAYIKAGTYTASTGGTWSNPAMKPANSGTATNRIAFRRYQSDVVTLDGQGGVSPIGIKGQNYITFDGFTVTNISSGGPAFCCFGNGAVALGLILENLTLTYQLTAGGGSNTQQIRLQRQSGATVRNCTLANVTNADSGSANSPAILMYFNDNCIIENNEIYNCKPGIHDKDDGDSNIFRYNLIYNCNVSGIRLHSHNGNTHRNQRVYQNIVRDCASAGIFVRGTSPSPLLDAQVYNNTVVDCGTNYSVAPTSTRVEVYNNVSKGSGAVDDITDSNGALSFLGYNCFYLSGSGYGGSNNVLADPLFVNEAADNYHLQGGSPCVNAGRTGGTLGAYITGTETIGTGASAPPADTEAPSVPTGLAGNPTSTTVVLTWNAATDNVGVADYRVFRGGSLITTVGVTAYTDTGLSAATQYTYTVSARDAALNESAQSGGVVVQTLDAPPLPVPTNTFLPTFDTYINANTTNYNGTDTLKIYTFPDNEPANVTILKFDLSGIPQGVEIDSATLKLYLRQSDTTVTDTYVISVHRILNMDPVTASATGYQAATGINWTANTVRADGIPLAQADLSVVEGTLSVNRTNEYKSFDVLTSIQAMIATPGTNYGIALNSSDTYPADAYRWFYSSDDPDTTRRPSLEITYKITYKTFRPPVTTRPIASSGPSIISRPLAGSRPGV